MTAAFPLMSARPPSAPIAWRDGVPVSAAEFTAAAQALAARLPEGRPVNLCHDRYRFALGLAAALLRGQASLMPPNARPETLAQLPPGAPPYALVDHDEPVALPLLRVVDDNPAAGAADAAPPQIDAGLEAVCLLTSGSTGAPQPHAKRWGPLVANIGAEAERLAAFLGRPTLAGLTIVATVPPQHSYGLESSVLLALLGGAAFDAGRPFYPADIAAALERVPRPRALVTTPFHLKTLLLAGLALPPVELILSATAPLSPQLAAEAEAALGGTLVEIYGCTEAGQVAARRTTAGETWATLGSLRVWQDGEDRFLVAGGHVVEPTPLADILELEDDCRFRLLGRANDLVHVAGKRSSLGHLNFQLNRIEGVADGAFWMPDETPGDVVRPVAFVVAPGLTPQAIVGALRRRLEPAFVPRRVIVVERLPREATGKLTVAALDSYARETLLAVEGRRFLAAAQHPAFAGHFPGHPLLPGVVLLGWVLEALDGAPSLKPTLGPAPQIEQVKFVAPVGPGQAVDVRIARAGRGLAFEVRRGDVLVAKGMLTP